MGAKGCGQLSDRSTASTRAPSLERRTVPSSQPPTDFDAQKQLAWHIAELQRARQRIANLEAENRWLRSAAHCANLVSFPVETSNPDVVPCEIPSDGAPRHDC